MMVLLVVTPANNNIKIVLMKRCKARNCAYVICLWDVSNVCLQEQHLAVLLISLLLISML